VAQASHGLADNILRWGGRQLRARRGYRSARWHEGGRSPRGSKYGIEEFLEVKYLCIGGIDR